MRAAVSSREMQVEQQWSCRWSSRQWNSSGLQVEQQWNSSGLQVRQLRGDNKNYSGAASGGSKEGGL